MAKFISPNSMVNKQLYICLLIAVSALFSCKDVTENKEVETTSSKVEETVICELIKTRVMLEDTTFKFQAVKDTVWVSYIKHRDSMRVKSFPGDMSQLSLWEYENYFHSFYNIFKNDRVLFTDTLLNIKPDYSSRTSIFKICDSVMFLDEPGKPTRWMCDSTSTISSIKALDFYEKWYSNNTDGSIRKDVLAYAAIGNNYRVGKFLPVFYVFKNKETYEQLKTKLQRKK